MPRIRVVIPTVRGREAALERTRRAYWDRTGKIGLELRVVKDPPTCGEGWLEGAEGFDGDYIHFGADDLEPHLGWWQPLAEACEHGAIGCPVVLRPDGTVQSAGGDFEQPNHLRNWIGTDWDEVGFTTVPFLTRAQWEDIGMLPIHYCSDAWVSCRGRQLGIETLLRPRSIFTHHMAGAGRLQTNQTDYEKFDRALREAVSA